MRTIPNLRWVIVFLLFAATMISYVDRQVLTVVAPTLRDELGISNTGYAQIITAFLIAYTVMQPVTGWLIDRMPILRSLMCALASLRIRRLSSMRNSDPSGPSRRSSRPRKMFSEISSAGASARS